jgi:hypothetical protein
VYIDVLGRRPYPAELLRWARVPLPSPNDRALVARRILQAHPGEMYAQPGGYYP